MGRAFVDEEPRTFKQLGDHLLTRWPDRDRIALEQTVRTGVPLIQVPPRGLWGRSGPVAHTSIEAWLGERPRRRAHDPRRRWSVATSRAFGPASVMDVQAWCGLTRLQRGRRAAAARPRDLPRRGAGASCSTCPTARARLPRRRPRRGSCTTSRTCSCRTRIGRGCCRPRWSRRHPDRHERADQHVHPRRLRGRHLEGHPGATRGDPARSPAFGPRPTRKRVTWPRKGSDSSPFLAPDATDAATSGSSIRDRRIPTCNQESLAL